MCYPGGVSNTQSIKFDYLVLFIIQPNRSVRYVHVASREIYSCTFVFNLKLKPYKLYTTSKRDIYICFYIALFSDMLVPNFFFTIIECLNIYDGIYSWQIKSKKSQGELIVNSFKNPRAFSCIYIVHNVFAPFFNYFPSALSNKLLPSMFAK